MTIVALVYLIFGILSGPGMARLGAETLGGVAVLIVTMIFTIGVEGESYNQLGVEFLPVSRFARLLIAAVYVVLPVVMAILATVATWRIHDRHLERRALILAAAVSLIFMPSAGKYVIFVSGPMSLAIALIAASGSIIAGRAYK
jgi:hypothetical protein